MLKRYQHLAVFEQSAAVLRIGSRQRRDALFCCASLAGSRRCDQSRQLVFGIERYLISTPLLVLPVRSVSGFLAEKHSGALPSYVAEPAVQSLVRPLTTPFPSGCARRPALCSLAYTCLFFRLVGYHGKEAGQRGRVGSDGSPRGSIRGELPYYVS